LREDSNQRLNDNQPNFLDDESADDKKKGVSKFYLNEEEEEKYLSYKPHRPEYLDWENIKLSNFFALKQYKESVYVGLLDENKKRKGQGVI